jgi:ubiquinone/menaquinone biosynthesis C-methylase UbiE
MVDRGERSFIRMPAAGARLYDALMQSGASAGYYREMAERLLCRARSGRFLDVGTGPGRLLIEFHALAPEMELHGLDVSAAMVALAGKNLAGIRADLKVGNVANTGYPDAYFSLVTASGSLYLWDDPVAGLTEIHRILEPGAAAMIFETHAEFDARAFKQAIRRNLAGQNPLLRLLAPRFMQRQLKMTYPLPELRSLLDRSPFARSCAIEKITLSNLPIWLLIELRRE